MSAAYLEPHERPRPSEKMIDMAANQIDAARAMLAALKHVQTLAVSAEGDEVFAEVSAAIAQAEAAGIKVQS